MSATTVTTPSLRDLRRSLPVFAATVCESTLGHSLSESQVRALTLDHRHTAILAPRGGGKSEAVAMLAVHHAFAEPRRSVLVISASDLSAKRLLGRVRDICQHELLRGSITDEQASRVTLSNGSIILSVPASERAVRGNVCSLLVLDESQLISDDLALGAALPTTITQADARVVAVGTPFAQMGWFYQWHQDGQVGSEHLVARGWTAEDCPWLTPAALDSLRTLLGPLRFAMEVELLWLGQGSAFLNPADLLANVADYELTPPSRAKGQTIVVGADWSGGAHDRHGLAGIGTLDDHAANEAEPPLFLAVCETEMRPFAEQVDRIIDLHDFGGRRSGYNVVAVRSEANGVGAWPSQAVAEVLGRRVEAVHSSARSKEEGFGRLRAWLTDRRIVLPRHPELLAQLRALTAEPLPSGSISIQAGGVNAFDDLADSLMLAALAVTPRFGGEATPEPHGGVEWTATPAGLRVPVRPMPRYHAFRSGGTFRRQ